MYYLKLFQNHSEYEAEKTSGLELPNVSHCINEAEVHYNPITDYSKRHFATVAREDGTISFNIWKSMGTDMIASISYSTDDGATWTTTQNQDNKSEHLSITVNVSEGDKILWKGDAQQTGYYDVDDYYDYVGSFFSSTCEFDAQGNVMSLLYGDNFEDETTFEYAGQFCCLFGDYDGELECKVVNANKLVLPATTLTSSCYYYMFKGCTSLVTAPELPATALAHACYSYMFKGCTSLVNAPQLPTTTLATYCYQDMFWNCTSLVNAPELPATTLVNSCYNSMFRGCTSLVNAPQLPATTLASGCYSSMFYGCTHLNYIKAMFTTTPSGSSPNYYTQNWVSGVAASGTFVKNSAATWNVSGVNGIPNGWTVETASV